MKKYSPSLFYFLLLCLVVLTTSCESNNDIYANAADGQSYNEITSHVPLAGEENMRDLGGIRGENGKPILKNMLFRSGELSALTKADKISLSAKGIKQIIDLRTAAERYGLYDQIIAGPVYYQVPMIANFSGGQSSQLILMDKIVQGKVNAYNYMMQFYTEMDDSEMAKLETIFDLLETGKSTLWHCTTGKDRTGMITALVLSSLGINKTTIIKDYMASNDFLSTSNQKIVGDYNLKYGNGAGSELLAKLEAKEDYINAFFNAIDHKYGNMNNFLNAIKVDRTKMKKLYLEN